MIYCFDLDGTLLDTQGGDYAKAKPIKERVVMLRDLYVNGNVIIINTGRNQIYEYFTAMQLEEYEIPYHALLVGAKPHADIYIDDKGMNAKDFFK